MAKEEKPLHIIKFEAENIKRLVAVSITPTGHLVELTGKNGAGKTSILDAIAWTLEGASGIQKSPIRKGQNKAWSRLDLGDYIVQRTFASVEDGGFTTSLSVDTKEGGRLTKGQTLINSFFGDHTLDPLAFARLKPKEQFDKLKGFVTGVDVEAIDAANRADFAKRTDVNRRKDEKAIEADAIAIPDATPAERVDESALVDELAAVGKHNADIELRRDRREVAKSAAARKRDEAASHRQSANALRNQAAEADAAAEEADEAAADLEKRLADAPPLDAPKDAAEIRARLDAAKVMNAAVDQAARRKKLKAEAEALEKEAAALTAKMAEREKAKREAIAAAKLPVEGVTFDDGAILLNGVPFDQASDAEQLRASVAIAMAGNPRIRVLRIRDGSLLDDDGRALVAKMAEERGWWVWMESVDSTGSRGFVIEDGQVRATPHNPAQIAAE